jgi:hypothetical protein
MFTDMTAKLKLAFGRAQLRSAEHCCARELKMRFLALRNLLSRTGNPVSKVGSDRS